MKRLILFALLSASAAFAAIRAVPAPVPPVIDGRLDDAVWTAAPAETAFQGYNTKTPRAASVRLAYTDTALVVGIEAAVPEAERQTAAAAATGVSVYNAESFEIMLDAVGDGDTYYHFVVNIANRRYFAWREQGGYVTSVQRDCDWQHAVSLRPDAWSAEIRIPYYTLQFSRAVVQAHKPWRINVVHNHYQTASKRLAVATLTGSAHAPSRFPAFDAPPAALLTPYCCRIAVGATESKSTGNDAEHRLGFTVQNDTARPLAAALDLAFRLPDGTRFVAGHQAAVAAPAGAGAAVAIPRIRFPAPGAYQAVATLRDRQTNAILARERFTHTVSFSPLRLTLLDPHYRNAIFATQKLNDVRYRIACSAGKLPDGCRLHTGIAQDGKTILETTLPVAPEQEVVFPVAKLPEGRLEIFAELRTPAAALPGAVRHPLRKLPYHPGEVWRGKDGVWRVDGKKTFILASWGSGKPSFVPEYSVVVHLRNETRSERKYINRSTIFGISKLRARLRKEGPVPEVLEQFRQVVRASKDHPGLFAHYLCDEPDCFGYTVSMLEPVTAAIADEDPYHPVLISTGSAGVVSYLACGELNGFHCYPFPKQGTSMNRFGRIVSLMDRAASVLARPDSPKQDILYLHQGFNYGDFGTSPMNRVPTYEEYRNQNYLALILGAKGLEHYNRTEEIYPELYLGLPQLVREEKLVGERAVIQEPADGLLKASPDALRFLARKGENGELWFIVCNVSEQPVEARLECDAFAKKRFTVLSEGRQLPLAAQVTERFTPFQVHIYTDARDLPALKSIEEIKAAIEAEYARRAKPGNLAWQRCEGERLVVTASSSAFAANRANQGLWHLTDGVTEGPLNPSTHGSGVIHYRDKTPGQLPDHVQYEFKAPVTIGRVVIYPIQNSLLDYEVQVRQGDAFVTVKKVAGADGPVQTVAFPPVKTQCLRLLVTANRGKNTMLYEMEVYEK